MRENALSVSFDSEGSRLCCRPSRPATVRQPVRSPEYPPGTRVPAIVVRGSWTTVKEQMAGLYVQRLAQHGFVTSPSTFDTGAAAKGSRGP
jgi:hypothetical protein